MNDRGMKKWRPFNAVVPNSFLKNSPESIELPSLSDEEIWEFEELLKVSMYTHSKVKITYIENAKIKEIDDYVMSIDPVKKDIYLKSKRINFRQIVNVQK